MYSMGTNRMRMRMFHTQQDVHPNHIFCPVVTAPSSSADYKPRVDWSNFHEVIALEQEELQSPHLQHVSKSWGALSSELVLQNYNNAWIQLPQCWVDPRNPDNSKQNWENSSNAKNPSYSILHEERMHTIRVCVLPCICCASCPSNH